MTTRTAHPSASFHRPLPASKAPAHWLMAQLGKRVLRPGGMETTRWLLDRVGIGPDDDVVELAPGLGLTARGILAAGPRSYLGVERDEEATRVAERATASEGGRVIVGDAAHVPLDDGAATVMLGEAMLSMQPDHKKDAIAAEVHRLLRPGGRYAIHELAVVPDDVDDELLAHIQRDLSQAIHVGVRIGTVPQWRAWLGAHGLEVEELVTTPMRLLEPERLIRDEGVVGTARFVTNAVRTPGALRRLRTLRATFRRHQSHLRAVALVARRAA
ncbi:MAG: class I SAM-dependent methyltransferase [Myxococcota bacterium]